VKSDSLESWKLRNIMTLPPGKLVSGAIMTLLGSEDDLDGDGIPNDYEAQHGLCVMADDSMGDLDGDLVPNR
jgi:hypothetical protein